MKLVLITDRYPFSYGEAFLESERQFTPQFEDIIILPCNEKTFENNRETTSGAKVYCHKESIPNMFQKVVGCLKAIFTRDVIKEWYNLLKKHQLNFDKFIEFVYFKYSKMQLIPKYKNYLEEQGIERDDKIIFYAYWLHHSAYVANQLAQDYPNAITISRAHGCDLYWERSMTNYIPFQEKNVKELDRVFCISDDGKTYLSKCYPLHANKISCSHLGTINHGIGKFYDKKLFKIISCSYAVPVKRLHLIVEILKRMEGVNIRWTHIGDGPELEKIQKICEELPSNVEVSFMGGLNNSEVIKQYENEEYHLFLNVSESEGIPVSIMEAISFGIPIVATDVGGTREIVNKATGILLDKDFEISEAVNCIKKLFYMDEKEYLKLRKSARRFWEENYSAQMNYKKFYDELIKMCNAR